MKREMGFIAAVLLGLYTSPSMAFDEYPELYFYEQAELTAGDLRAIEIAMPEFRKRFNWQNYKVAVSESEFEYLVEFWQPEREAHREVLAIWDRDPGGKTDKVPVDPTIVRVGSFRIKLNMKTLRPVWNSVDNK